MYEGTTVQCPRCRAHFEGPRLENVRIEGDAAMAIGMQCPYCELDFPMVTQPGAYSTVNGRLTLIQWARGARQAIVSDAPDLDQLREVRAALREGASAGQAPEEILANLRALPKFQQWCKENQVPAAGIFTILGALLSAIIIVMGNRWNQPDPADPPTVVVNQLSDEQWDDLIEKAVEVAQKREPKPAPMPAHPAPTAEP